jgi:hypothetical protein
MMTNVHVFHCSEVECRWGRGVEYTSPLKPPPECALLMVAKHSAPWPHQRAGRGL